jgi:exodeoxyribonuclease X
MGSAGGALVTAWTEYRYAVIDVEGNGQLPPELVELGIVPVVSGVIGAPVTWLCKPERPITPMARRIHGIGDAMVDAAPSFSGVEADIRANLDGAVLVAHNAGVDLGVLRRKMPGFTPAGVLDTLKLSRRLLPDQPSHRLGELARTLPLDQELPDGLHPHRAGYDVLVTARLFVYLMSFAELSGRPGGDDHTLF